MADYYNTLGVSRDATTEEIKKAFRRIARETHPDANPGDPATEARFRAAAEAYEVLSDPDRRRRYDHGDVFDLSGLFGSGGLDDILRSVFGDGGLFGARPQRPRRGRDVLVRVEIDLTEAAFGVEVPITFSTRVPCEVCGGNGALSDDAIITCPDCHGAGSLQTARRSVFGTMMTTAMCSMCGGEGSLIRERCQSCSGTGAEDGEVSLKVEIPPGVTSGTRLRLNGRGESAGRAGSTGDLFVEVHVRPHDVFRREGDDLVMQIGIGIAAASLGTRVTLPTLDGDDFELEVPRGIQPGSVITLDGLGMTRLGGRSRGDLHVVVGLKVPETLTVEEEELLARYADLSGEQVERRSPTG